jgi:predicted DNA-binding antitoxin AbrB/MazE fold protein
MSKTIAKQIVEAIYEGGMLHPLQPLDIPDRQRVQITVTAFEPVEGIERVWQRITQRREMIFQRHGKLGDSSALIREDRENR